MIVANINDLTGPAFVAAKARAYWELLKFRLSFLVAFSCAFGYVLASPEVNWIALAMLFLGGFLLSGSSVIINQIIEKDLDSLMTRTMNRPLPTYRVSVNEATSVAVFCLLAGVTILLLYTNVLTTILSVVSMILYGFVYTPLKRVGPIAVFRWRNTGRASTTIRMGCRNGEHIA